MNIEINDRKEFVCKECGGRGFFCNDHECSDSLFNVDNCTDCGGKVKCNTCNGTGHIPLPEMLMLVNEALCDANRAFRDGKIADWSLYDKAWDGVVGSPSWIGCYTKVVNTSEHYLALAVVRLREIAEIIGRTIKNDNSNFCKSGWTNISADIRMIIRIVDQADCVFAINLINGFCNHHKIPLEKHISALIAYEKESKE